MVAIRRDTSGKTWLSRVSRCYAGVPQGKFSLDSYSRERENESRREIAAFIAPAVIGPRERIADHANYETRRAIQRCIYTFRMSGRDFEKRAVATFHAIRRLCSNESPFSVADCD